MTKIVWSLRASKELVKQIDYIAKANTDAADRMGDAVEAKAAWLADWPLAGQRLGASKTRSFRVPGTPFVLVYRAITDEVTIVRLRHTRQNWRT